MDTPPPDPRIERARLMYVESDIPLREIAHRLGVSKGTLSRWVNLFAWPPRLDRSAAKPRNEPPARPSTKPLAPSARTPPRTGRSRKRPSTRSLLDRLYRIITHNLELMESRMSDEDHTANDNPERDARAIGNLVRSVEKLKELEPDHSKRDTGTLGKNRYPLSPGEEDRLRDEIVERLLKLRERMGDQTSGR